MRLVCWNVNSINARIERFTAYLQRHRPDIICLQELKADDSKLPLQTFQELGYTAQFVGQKTYNGVAVLSLDQRNTLVAKSLPDVEFAKDARLVHTEVGGLNIISAYIPNGQEVGSDKYLYKLRWMEALSRYVGALSATARDTLIVSGDFNIARSPLDVYDAKALEGRLLYSPMERKALESFISDHNFIDTFRHLHPQEQKFSWWDYRSLAFAFNRGLRIDYIFIAAALQSRLKAAWIDRDERKGAKPSDHAPIGIELQ